MIDFLGREYGVGDTVVYAAGSGRSITMVYGEVVELRDNGSVKVLPLGSARWEQHCPRTRFVDSRTGKGIDPHSGGGKHHEVPSHFRHRDTGETISYEQFDERFHSMPPSTRPPYAEGEKFEYVPPVFKDYVKEVTEDVRPVTLTITDNIVKIDRPADGDGIWMETTDARP